MDINKKSSILLVLKVLEEYTDEDHYLMQQEIANKINEIYGLEIERKSIGSSLKILEELDYDIDKGPKGGFALLSRTFDKVEASYIIDAIFSSRSIDGKRAKNIIDAVSSTLSKYQRKDYSYIYKSTEITRTKNSDVLYNASVIEDAIKENKKISFQYQGYDKNGNPILRKEGFKYIVSPYYLINNFGRYYLLSNYSEKYSSFNIFRIDYMKNINIEDEIRKSLNELKECPKDFSISKYMNEHLYMLGGDTINVTLELDDEIVITYIKDWFGESAKIWNEDNKLYASVSSNENALYFWIMQYSNSLKVISPDNFVEKIKNGLNKALDRYK